MYAKLSSLTGDNLTQKEKQLIRVYVYIGRYLFAKHRLLEIPFSDTKDGLSNLDNDKVPSYLLRKSMVLVEGYDMWICEYPITTATPRVPV